MATFVVADPAGQLWAVEAASAQQATDYARSFYRARGFTDDQLRNLVARTGTDAELAEIDSTGRHIQPPQPASTQPGGGQPGEGVPPGGGPPPGGGGGGGGGGGTSPPGTYLPEEIEEGRRGAFERVLQARGLTGAGLFSGLARRQFDPYQATFEARQALGDFPEQAGAEQGFERFAAETRNPFQAALEAFKRIRGTPIALAEGNLPLTGYLRPGENPETATTDFTNARQLFEAALRGRVGGAAASFLSNYIPAAQRGFYAAPKEQTGGDFLSYLIGKLGLGRAF